MTYSFDLVVIFFSLFITFMSITVVIFVMETLDCAHMCMCVIDVYINNFNKYLKVPHLVAIFVLFVTLMLIPLEIFPLET